MQFEDLDKKIKEAADQHHPAYDEKAWRKMEKLLNQHLPLQKDDRRRILFLLLFLLVGVGGFLMISQPWNKKINIDKGIAQKSTKNVQPDNSNGASEEHDRTQAGSKQTVEAREENVPGADLR